MKVVASLLLFLATSSTSTAIRLYFNDDSNSASLQNSSYPSHNIFISNGATLQLTNGASITAPASVDDGESAIRIDDASFIGVNGTITGGANFGGIGVTISSSRDGRQTAQASFGAAMAVYGGDAARKETTQGGDAVQVIQSGSRATFDGGTIVAGRGCSQEVCGVSNNGNAIKVVMGEVIVKGGMFDGDFYNLQGSIQIYGCVAIDDEKKDEDGRMRIKGVLSDGSSIDVAYVGEEEQLEIVYDESVCPPAVAAPTIDTSGVEFDSFGKNSFMLSVLVSIAASLAMG
mmetsp:Transcript_12175/g.17508  ORF Transcript_12175/g.17508 Transcript_12175/m.17508 type:complete len:288 (-) Transcript_12175:108-971(-)